MAEIITTCGKVFAEEVNGDVTTEVRCTPLNMCNECVAECEDCSRYRSACAPHRGVTRDG